MRTASKQEFLTCFIQKLWKRELKLSFTQLVHDHLSQFSKESDYYFLSTRDSLDREGKDLQPICNKPGKSTNSARRSAETIANGGDFRSMFETTMFSTFWIKVKAEYLNITIKVLKPLPSFFQHQFVNQGFLQW